MIAINKKTLKRYVILEENIINATNSNDGQLMIAYQSLETYQVYVREKKEFYEKFDVIGV